MHTILPLRFLSRMGKKTGVGVCVLALLFAGQVLAGESESARLAARALLLDVAASGSTMVAVGERGHVLRSSDSGKNWQQVITPTTALLTAITFADAEHGWAVGQNATILATVDGGASWKLQFETSQLPEDDDAADSPLLSISCISTTSCVAAGAYGLFLKTDDGGANWQRHYVKEGDRNVYAIRMLDADNIVIAGEAGSLLTSADGGAEWIALMPPYDGSFFGFTVAPDNSWILFGLRGHVLRSEDKGANWADIATGVDSSLMGGRVLPDGRIALAGASGVVLLSSDNGRSFTLQRQSARAALSTITAAPDGSLWLFGEKGVQPLEVQHDSQ